MQLSEVICACVLTLLIASGLGFAMGTVAWTQDKVFKQEKDLERDEFIANLFKKTVYGGASGKHDFDDFVQLCKGMGTKEIAVERLTDGKNVYYKCEWMGNDKKRRVWVNEKCGNHK